MESKSSYAEILLSLVVHALKKGLISENDILDLKIAGKERVGGEDLYYRESLEFQSHIQQHSKLQEAGGFETNQTEKFNHFWNFIQGIREGNLFRPQLTREQAQQFLNADPSIHNEKEIRSVWMERVFDLFTEHLPDYKGNEADYQKLSKMPEVMLQLNFSDAAYQNLENMELEQMCFKLKESGNSLKTVSKKESILENKNNTEKNLEKTDMNFSQ